MRHLEPDGRLVFTIDAPGAAEVEILGAFRGWNVERIPMEPAGDGQWRLELNVAAGEYRYRVRVDGRERVDDQAHGTRRDADGLPWSRAWRPDWTWAESGFTGDAPAQGAAADAA